MDGMHARHGFWGKEWDLRTEDEAVLMWIARLALLVSSLRGMNKSTEEDEAETPYRAFNILVSVACGHALVHERNHLDLSDVAIVTRLAIGSVRRGVSRLLTHLLTVGPFDKKTAREVVRPRTPEEDREWGKATVSETIEKLTRAGIVKWNGHEYLPTSDFPWSNPLDFKDTMAFFVES
jgi:hypothetical protein